VLIRVVAGPRPRRRGPWPCAEPGRGLPSGRLPETSLWSVNVFDPACCVSASWPGTRGYSGTGPQWWKPYTFLPWERLLLVGGAVIRVELHVDAHPAVRACPRGQAWGKHGPRRGDQSPRVRMAFERARAIGPACAGHRARSRVADGRPGCGAEQRATRWASRADIAHCGGPERERRGPSETSAGPAVNSGDVLFSLSAWRRKPGARSGRRLCGAGGLRRADQAISVRGDFRAWSTSYAIAQSAQYWSCRCGNPNLPESGDLRLSSTKREPPLRAVPLHVI